MNHENEIYKSGDHRKRRCDDEEGDEHDSKQNKWSAKPDGTNRLLACPYFKMDPIKFSRSKVCCGPGWRNVYRLKEHLYRKHAPPQNQCSRCLHSFPSPDALSIHQRHGVICEIHDYVEAFDRFNPKQHEQLRQRTKHPLNKTEEDKWIEIYKILFPGTKVPSPYYDYHITEPAEFANFFRAKFQPNLRDQLEQALQLDQTTVDRIIAASEKSMEKVWVQWQNLHVGASLANAPSLERRSRITTPRVNVRKRDQHIGLPINESVWPVNQLGNELGDNSSIELPGLSVDLHTIPTENEPEFPIMQPTNQGPMLPTYLAEGNLSEDFSMAQAQTSNSFTSESDTCFDGHGWDIPLYNEPYYTKD
ncbi:hypothetical protein B0I35DRAFT_94893 [Stachybotrys elegans]|uniref:C2H2-type domain-containing protein n=1 Tax=Stachybotrys elegans TaxID=80388 RepID=A0A8K0WMS6_9HYPO|nr:hypothetical protein B0I35DRAFT_94893 [Stachybotrys elegans]